MKVIITSRGGGHFSGQPGQPRLGELEHFSHTAIGVECCGGTPQ